MATGIIQVDLHQSKSGFYFDSTKELIDKYLSGDHSLETINKLIVELIDDEVIYFTEEDFIYWALYETKYNIISKETFIKLKQDEMLPSALGYSLAMYGNFKYEDKKFIYPDGKDNYLAANMPCMVYFDKHIVTFFILGEYGDAGII